MLCMGLMTHTLDLVSVESNPGKVDIMSHVVETSKRGLRENNLPKVTELAGVAGIQIPI